MKSLIVHYKNKYPKGRVHASDSSLDVFNDKGEHVIALRKNGAGQMLDESEALGLRDRHDLAPIPKDARVHKVVDGKIGLSEEAEERAEKAKGFLCPKHSDRVMSCAEAKAHGFAFDDKQKEIKKD